MTKVTVNQLPVVVPPKTYTIEGLNEDQARILFTLIGQTSNCYFDYLYRQLESVGLRQVSGIYTWYYPVSAPGVKVAIQTIDLDKVNF